MPQVIIHTSSELEIGIKQSLVTEIRESLIRILKIDERIGHVVLYETPEFFRSAHESRNRNFILVQIEMYEGRSEELKRELMENILSIISGNAQISKEDIVCFIHEIPEENYLGGINHLL